MRSSGPHRILILAALALVAGCRAGKDTRDDMSVPGDATGHVIRFAAVRDARVTPEVPSTTAALSEVMSDLSALRSLDFLALAGGSIRDASDAEIDADAKELKSIVGITDAPKVVVQGGADLRNASRVRESYASLAAKIAEGHALEGQLVKPGLRVIVLDTPQTPTASGAPLDAAEASKARIEASLQVAAPDETIIALAYGPPPRGAEAKRLAADHRVKVLLVGLRGEAAPDEPWRDVPIVEVPSLTKDGCYVVVTIDAPRVIIAIRSPYQMLPVSEIVRPLRK